MGGTDLEYGRFFLPVNGQAVLVSGGEGIALDLVIQGGRGAGDGEQVGATLRQLGKAGQQRPGVGVTGLVENLLHGAHLHDLTAIEDGHTLGNVGNNAQVMGDIHGGEAQLVLQILDEPDDLSLNGHVQSGGGLVTDQDLGLAGQGDGDNDTLTHTAGVLEGVVIKPLLGVRDADLGHDVDGALPGLGIGALLVLLNDGHDLLADGDDRVQGGHGILEHGGDPAAADLLPVVGVLHLGAVDDGVAVNLVLFLVQGAELHTEGNQLKNLIQHVAVRQILADAHSQPESLIQLVQELDLGTEGIPANGQKHLVGNLLVPLQNGVAETTGVFRLVGLGDLLLPGSQQLPQSLLIVMNLLGIAPVSGLPLGDFLLVLLFGGFFRILVGLNQGIDLGNFLFIVGILLVQSPEVVGTVNHVIVQFLDALLVGNLLLLVFRNQIWLANSI